MSFLAFGADYIFIYNKSVWSVLKKYKLTTVYEKILKTSLILYRNKLSILLFEETSEVFENTFLTNCGLNNCLVEIVLNNNTVCLIHK